MELTPKLIDDIYRERVLRARATPPGEKLLAGPRLFDQACRIMANEIRVEFPDADERRVQEILFERLDRKRRLEERDLYRVLVD